MPRLVTTAAVLVLAVLVEGAMIGRCPRWLGRWSACLSMKINFVGSSLSECMLLPVAFSCIKNDKRKVQELELAKKRRGVGMVNLIMCVKKIKARTGGDKGRNL